MKLNNSASREDEPSTKSEKPYMKFPWSSRKPPPQVAKELESDPSVLHFIPASLEGCQKTLIIFGARGGWSFTLKFLVMVKLIIEELKAFLVRFPTRATYDCTILRACFQCKTLWFNLSWLWGNQMVLMMVILEAWIITLHCEEDKCLNICYYILSYNHFIYHDASFPIIFCFRFYCLSYFWYGEKGEKRYGCFFYFLGY